MNLNGIDIEGLEHDTPLLDIPEPVKGRIAHIDADFLAYQCSAQGSGDQKSFEDMKHNAEIRVATIKALAGAEHIHLHLTPSTSDKGDRHAIALLKGYQLNRVGKEHPQYLHIMRQHLAEKYPGTLHQFCEADDGMSSAQYADPKNSIIVSKDKDLSMVPGLHLDWDTGEISDSNGDYGRLWIVQKSSKKLVGIGHKFFWAQMLMGDTADNISGLPAHYRGSGFKDKKIGPVYAAELLEGVNSNKDAFAFVKGLYEGYGKNTGFTNHRDGSSVAWQHAFISEAQLLWMRRDAHNKNCVLQWFKEINQ